MPYHGIILSAIYGVPVAGWSYSTKTDYLATELGLELPDKLIVDPPMPHLVPESLVLAKRREAMTHFKRLDFILA
jgi:hypothetical protein